MYIYLYCRFVYKLISIVFLKERNLKPFSFRFHISLFYLLFFFFLFHFTFRRKLAEEHTHVHHSPHISRSDAPSYIQELISDTSQVPFLSLSLLFFIHFGSLRLKNMCVCLLANCYERKH